MAASVSKLKMLSFTSSKLARIDDPVFAKKLCLFPDSYLEDYLNEGCFVMWYQKSHDMTKDTAQTLLIANFRNALSSTFKNLEFRLPYEPQLLSGFFASLEKDSKMTMLVQVSLYDAVGGGG
jgi:hypothetical protein